MSVLCSSRGRAAQWSSNSALPPRSDFSRQKSHTHTPDEGRRLRCVNFTEQLNDHYNLCLFLLHSKQVTRGHNIVADGWAGASKPYSHSNPPPTLKHTQKVSKTLICSISTRSLQTDRRTKGPRDQCNGPTGQRTDKASYTLFFL